MARTLVKYLFLVALGAGIAFALVKNERIRRAMHFANQPVLLAEVLVPDADIEGTTTPLTEAMPMTAVPPEVRRSKRVSWEMLDHRRPKDPATDPTTGRTQIMYLDAPLEQRLSSVLSSAKLPLPVLRLGAVTVADRSVVGVEFFCGRPPGRPAIEETAARLVHLVFESSKAVDEVDAIAVPWRTVHGYKPPAYFSVSARRVDYIPSMDGISVREILDRYGATWWDARVMSDFPYPTPEMGPTARTP